MLKWADRTRRRLNSQTDLTAVIDSDDTHSMIYDGRVDDSGTSSLTSAVSLIDLTDISKRKLSPVEKKRMAFAKNRPKSLFMTPSSCKDEAGGSDLPIKPEASHQSSWHGTPTTPTTDITDALTARRHSLNSASNQSVNNTSSTSPPLKITTKPELLRISTNSSQDKNSHSFWKNLMNKKSWPKRTSDKRLEKSASMLETYRKLDDPDTTAPSSCSGDISPIETDISIDTGLAEIITCDRPINSSVSRKESLKSIKRRNCIKRPKKFTRRSVDISGDSITSSQLQRQQRCTMGDMSPDSGYCDTRFSSTSAAVSSDEETSSTPESPAPSIKSDFQYFFDMKDLANSLDKVRSIREMS